MVVPIYKKWEANLARIQIVRQEKMTQLLAFFADFHHGTCMNFVLKGTDHIESFGRSGKFGIRIVDAKFALPKKNDDPASDFVCLDMPEYPIEHDDIAITFDTEAGEFAPAAIPRVWTNSSCRPCQLQGGLAWIGTRAVSNGISSSIIPSPIVPSPKSISISTMGGSVFPAPRDPAPLSPGGPGCIITSPTNFLFIQS